MTKPESMNGRTSVPESKTTFDPEKYYCIRCGKEMADDQDVCDHYGRDLVKERRAAIAELAKAYEEATGEKLP